jgi:hypothetical protein
LHHNPQFFTIWHTNPPKINLHDTHASQTKATIYNLVTNTKRKEKEETKRHLFVKKEGKKFW